MKSVRVSIAGLMLAVVIGGAGLAAMLRPSEIASKAAFTVALAS